MRIECESKEEWLKERWATIGGSELKDFAVNPRSGIKLSDMTISDPQLEQLAHKYCDYFVANATRGTNLEVEALEFFAETEHADKLKEIQALDNILIKEDFLFHASPDGQAVNTKGKKVALETKCLGAGKHLKSFLEDGAGEFRFQVANYFNAGFEQVYLIFYCPEMTHEKLKMNVKIFDKRIFREELKELKELKEKIKKLYKLFDNEIEKIINV